MKCLVLHRLSESLSKPKIMQKSPKNSAGLFDTYLKAKTTKFFALIRKLQILEFFEKLQMQIKASSCLWVNKFLC
jgi:hypothetical protein